VYVVNVQCVKRSPSSTSPGAVVRRVRAGRVGKHTLGATRECTFLVFVVIFSDAIAQLPALLVRASRLGLTVTLRDRLGASV
jgi:hypothetical protein